MSAVSLHRVTPVEMHRVPEIQAVHPMLKPVLRDLDHQVVVRRHEAVHVADPGASPDDDVQLAEEELPILVVEEDRLLRTRGDVVNAACDLDAK